MNTAQVGFQCPECVSAAGQKVVTARSLGPTQPYLIMAIIAANVAMFVAQQGSQSFQNDLILIGRTPIPGIGVDAGEWWRLLSGGFLHGDLLHLGFNMYLAWALGGALERSLGWIRLAVLYFGSLLAGSLGVMVVTAETPTLGASGAVFGLMGALAYLQQRSGQNPLTGGIGGLLLINLVLTFARPNISIGGHIGGLIGGVLLAALISTLDPEKPSRPGGGTIAAAFLGLGFGIAAIFLAGVG